MKIINLKTGCSASNAWPTQYFPLFLIALIASMLLACERSKDVDEISSDKVSLVKNDSLHRLDIFINSKFFSSYLYTDTLLRKPVLFPLHASGGERVTRGYPFAPNAGERTDHPHHYGLWFNHGDVNGVDFWNSSVTSKNKKARYGRINHTKFIEIRSGETGTLEVEKEWRSETDQLLLVERTKYIFSGSDNTRVIKHTATLTAPEVDVLFKDSKEGMFAMRVRRELEIPSDERTRLLTSSLVPADSSTVDSLGVSGHYRNSNGIEGYPEVWGQRAKWMQLSGVVNNDSISICIFDHPDNVNHPPHWMARDYGLYGVNPLGSNMYTAGKEQLNFLLKKGDSVTFKHQVIIADGINPPPDTIEAWYKDFIANDPD